LNYRRLQLALPTVLLSAATLFAAAPTLAHHSFAAFEDTRIRTLEGTVKTFKWTNPHVMLTVLVNRDDSGERQEWTIVTSGPAILTRFGWRRSSMKTGDRTRIVCNPLRDGSPGCRLHTLTMLDTGQILKTKLSVSTDLDVHPRNDQSVSFPVSMNSAASSSHRNCACPRSSPRRNVR
jgi:hypothetical protein